MKESFWVCRHCGQASCFNGECKHDESVITQAEDSPPNVFDNIVRRMVSLTEQMTEWAKAGRVVVIKEEAPCNYVEDGPVMKAVPTGEIIVTISMR